MATTFEIVWVSGKGQRHLQTAYGATTKEEAAKRIPRAIEILKMDGVYIDESHLLLDKQIEEGAIVVNEVTVDDSDRPLTEDETYEVYRKFHEACAEHEADEFFVVKS